MQGGCRADRIGGLQVGVRRALAGSGVLLMALLFRDPRTPRWTAIAVVAPVLAVPVTGLIGFGLSHLLTGGYRLLHGVGNPLELAALLGVAAALVLLILPIRRRSGRTPRSSVAWRKCRRCPRPARRRSAALTSPGRPTPWPTRRAA